MTGSSTRPRRVLAALAAGLGLPLCLAAVLNVMRPDLMAQMLDHDFGFQLVFVERVLCLAATAVSLVAALVNFKTRTLRVLVTVAGALLFTLPALFGILFGLILFAFLHVPPQ